MTPFYKTASLAATAETVSSLKPEVRKQRAKALADFDRRKRLEAARQDVEAARAALNQIRDTAAEEAALDAAMKRLAEIEGEAHHDA